MLMIFAHLTLKVKSGQKFRFKACSHELGSVSYQGATIAQGQALPSVHMVVCSPRETLSRVKFIAPGQAVQFLVFMN